MTARIDAVGIADTLHDFTVNPQGTIVLMHPETVAAKALVREILADQPEAMTWGEALVVEHRLADGFVEHLLDDGYTVAGERPHYIYAAAVAGRTR